MSVQTQRRYKIMPKFNFDDVRKSKVQYHNPQFAMFERCLDTDRNMTWREWIKNAIEAAVKEALANKDLLAKGKIPIYVRALPVNGLLEGLDFTHPKLCTMQPGGMDYKHLETATKMSCEYDKKQGIKSNRGNGLRITASLHTDILFVTRKNGVALMRLIGWRGPANKKSFFQTEIERCDQWVNDNAEARNYPEGDFTEVIFMGVESEAKQNTLLHPFGETDKQSKRTCISTIFRRFWEIPDCIEIIFQQGKDEDSTPHSAGYKRGSVVFKTWLDSFKKSQKEVKSAKDSVYECTSNSDGYKLHQFFDAPQSDGDMSTEGITSSHNSSPFSGLLYGPKGELEIFNLIEGTKSLQRSLGKFGIINGHKYFRFFLEVPYDLYGEDPTRKYLVREGDPTNTRRYFNDDDLIQIMKSLVHPDIQSKINELNKEVQTEDIDDLIKQELAEYQQDDLDIPKGNGTKKRPKNPNPQPLDPKICPNCGTEVAHRIMECPNCDHEWQRRKRSAVRGNNHNHGNFNSIVPPQFDHLYGDAISTAGMTTTFARFNKFGGANGRDQVLINTEHSVVDQFVRKINNSNENIDHLLRDEAIKLLKVKLAVFIILAKGQQEAGTIDDVAIESLFSDVVLTMNAKQHNEIVYKLKATIGKCEALFKAEENDSSLENIKWEPSKIVEGYTAPIEQ